MMQLGTGYRKFEMGKVEDKIDMLGAGHTEYVTYGVCLNVALH